MKMKNWFTTVSGIIAGLPPLVNAVYPALPPQYVAAISAIGMILTGLSAKDYNEPDKSGK